MKQIDAPRAAPAAGGAIIRGAVGRPPKRRFPMPRPATEIDPVDRRQRLQKKSVNATWPAVRDLSLATLLAMLSGCASIFGHDTETLPVASTPPGAQILVIDETGRTVHRGRTPGSVTLAKSDGHYWGGKTFDVAISKRGYATRRVTVTTRPNTLYLGGNLLSANLIGWFLVDPLNGKMYELSTDRIAVDLEPLPGKEAAAQRAAAASAELQDPAVGDKAVGPASAAASPPTPTGAAPVPAIAAPAADVAPSAPPMVGPPEAAVPLPVPAGEPLPAAGPLAQPAAPAAAPPVEASREAPVMPPEPPAAVAVPAASETVPPRPYLPPPPAFPVGPSSALPSIGSLA